MAPRISLASPVRAASITLHFRNPNLNLPPVLDSPKPSNKVPLYCFPSCMFIFHWISDYHEIGGIGKWLRIFLDSWFCCIRFQFGFWYGWFLKSKEIDIVFAFFLIVSSLEAISNPILDVYALVDKLPVVELDICWVKMPQPSVFLM